MKAALLTISALFALDLTACASAQKPAPASLTSAAVEKPAAPAAPESTPEPAKDKEKEKAAPAGDPLALNGSLALPKIEHTPAKQLRRNGPGDLQAALAGAQTQKDLPAAISFLEKRLGKPNWIEGGQKRFWIAPTAEGCQRLVLEADGSLAIDGASKSAATMLAPGAYQSACTGEIAADRK